MVLVPVFSSKYPSQTVQQLNALLTEETGRLGRVVYLTDEDYTVDARDDLIVLAATTSAGNYTLTFPTTLPPNVRCLVVMPTAPTGTDDYVTSGLGSVITFDAAGLTLGTLTLGGSTIAENPSAVVPLSLVAGNLVLTSGVRLQANLPSAADDAAAAALSPAVPVGGLYHTAGAVKQRLV